MRYPQGHKEEVRAGIVEAASRALRRDGLAGVSVPALMKEAGLTHGGFYGHFKNRDELVAEAVLAAAEATATRVLSGGEGGLPAVLDEPGEDDRPHHARGERERLVVEPTRVGGRTDLSLEEVQEAPSGLRECMAHRGALTPGLASQPREDAAAPGIFDVSP